MFLGIDLTLLVATYGIWAVALFVAIESMGVPVPGETMLLVAAVYAGATHQLSIVAVIATASVAAIVGDNLGYLLGRLGGERLLRRVGPALHLTEGRLAIARYLFQKHGGKAVFFGRFVAILRVFAAFLAGTAHMSWRRFALANAAGVIAWATLMSLLGYGLGASATGPLGYIAFGLAAVIIVAGAVVLRRNEGRWERQAVQAMTTAHGAGTEGQEIEAAA
ncbi:MAG TPA: DedA family protein [Chloroflexota bacterium]|jgi:membrane protein DedA with SNARE-associated domain|nr:DedA family protein [Chloroflexota bacterium]